MLEVTLNVIPVHQQVTFEQVFDDLTYACYRHNRVQNPNTTPEQWRTVFGKRTDALESRFQEEQGSAFIIVTEGFPCEHHSRRVRVAAEVDGTLVTSSVR